MVHGVVEAGPADRAGVRPGDRIGAANGRGIAIFADLQSYVRLRPEEPIRFTVEREGESLQVNVMTDAMVIRDSFGNEARLGSLGVTSGPPTFEKLSTLKLVGAAVDQNMETVREMGVTRGQGITGGSTKKEMGEAH